MSEPNTRESLRLGLSPDVVERLAFANRATGRVVLFFAPRVPEALRVERFWRVWRAVPRGDHFGKAPVDRDGELLDGWQLPDSDLTFAEACDRLAVLRAKLPAARFGLGAVRRGAWIFVDLDRDDSEVEALRSTGCYVEASLTPGRFHAVGRRVNGEGEPLEVKESGAVGPFNGFMTIVGGGDGDPMADIGAIVAGLRLVRNAGHATTAAPTTKTLPRDGGAVAPGGQEDALFRTLCALRRSGLTEAAAVAAMWTEVKEGRLPTARGREPWTRYDIEAKARHVWTRYPVSPVAVEATRESLRVLTADDVINEPDVPAVVVGLAWAGCVSVLVSESGTGKTFLLLDASAHVAQGRRWRGRRTRFGTVVYVSFEGDALNTRLLALREARHDLAHLRVIRAANPISPATTREGVETISLGEAELTAALEALAADVEEAKQPPVVLIVIDTVRASLVGSEDSSESVSAYLRAVKRIARSAPGAAIVLAHHSGWQDGELKKRRERGSSAFRGNVDGTFYLSRTGDVADGLVYLELEALKVRDGGTWKLPLRLRVVDLGTFDADGNPRTTLRVEDADAADLAKAKAKVAEQRDEVATLKLLQAIHGAELTSVKAIARASGLRNETVSGLIPKLVRDGLLVLPEKQRQPFRLTDAGRRLISAEPGGLSGESGA